MNRPRVKTERVEAAFEAFDHEDLHELRQVALALEFLFGPLACVIRERFVARVFEFGNQQTNCFVEDFILLLVELVEEGFGVFRPRET